MSVAVFATRVWADSGGQESGPWQEEKALAAEIHAPTFPARVFDITDYGAKSGGQVDCSGAIRDAIAACAQGGGGRVRVPDGVYLTGPIHLQSNVELHLETRATLKFTTDTQAYLPEVLTRFEGNDCYNYSPLIYAFGAENVAVTGSGLLDGQADAGHWWNWKNDNRRGELVKMANANVPVDQRRFGAGAGLRPDFIEFNRCENVMISGVRIRRSPMWEIHPLLCTNVVVRDVDIYSHGANNDGCDPECCRNVLIDHCLFDTGDDCIAIKSGRNNDGRRLGLPSVNLIVRDCTMKDGHAGVAIGSEISGSCSNVFVERCIMSSPNLLCALRLKSNAARGGVLQGIYMRDVQVGLVKDSVLQIDFLYGEGTNGDYLPVARNVHMENVTVAHTPRILDVRGFPGADISDVTLRKCRFLDVRKPDILRDADVKIEDCEVQRAG